ncbi:MAG: hypothetical protein ACK58L_21700 [Planctomycetota bacterium]
MNESEILTRYEAHGVRFDYPGYWEVSEEQDGADRLITVTADGTSFWALRIISECPRADEVIRSCIEAFEEEYEDVEVHEQKSAILANMPAVCREVNFSCFELLNSVSLTSVRSSEMTLLAWWQGTDHELEDVRPIFEQMTKSIRILSVL